MENKCCHVWKLTILILWYCSNYISILVQSALLRESWVKHGLLLDGGKGTLLVIFGTRSSTVSTCAWMPLFSSVQLLSRVRLFATPWTAACQASLSITSSWSLLKLMSIESVMPSNHLILCHPLLLPPSIVPSIRVFSNESVLHIRWPKYWSFMEFHGSCIAEAWLGEFWALLWTGGWMASPTQWTWVWVNSRSWW